MSKKQEHKRIMDLLAAPLPGPSIDELIEYSEKIRINTGKGK